MLEWKIGRDQVRATFGKDEYIIKWMSPRWSAYVNHEPLKLIETLRNCKAACEAHAQAQEGVEDNG